MKNNMTDIEKLNFIADVEMSTFSQELKESLLEMLDEDKMMTFDNVEDAINYMHKVTESNNEKS